MPTAVKHNKKKNIGIIYELLIRHLSEAFVEGNDGKIASVMGILKKHFLFESAIKEENQYYCAAISSKCANQANARRILETLIKHHRRHTPPNLEEARLSLVQDIGRKLSPGFWKYPLDPELYKAMASAYKVLHYRDADVKLEGALDLARSKSFLVEQMTKPALHVKTLDELKQDIEPGVVDRLLLTRCYQLYNKEYVDLLNENQKALLTSYYAYLNNGDKKAFSKVLDEARSSLYVALKKARNSQILKEAPDATQKNFYEALGKFETEVLKQELKAETYEACVKSLMLYEGLLIEMKGDK